MSPVTLALLLTTAAGLCTTVGAVLVFVVRRPGPRFMAFTLGFAAGVMLLISFASLLPKALEELGEPLAYLAFFLGIAAMFALDVAIPHSYQGVADHAPGGDPADPRLLRLGLFVALGIGLHNFPEGMATFAGTLADPNLGLAIAVAIALHNIPEGLAVAAPVYAATGRRGQAFLWSFLSGVAEPVGAGLAALVLLPYLHGPTLAVVLAGVAGLMVYISLDELLPAAHLSQTRAGGLESRGGGRVDPVGQELASCHPSPLEAHHPVDRTSEQAHTAILGTTAGMAVMALSLWLLG